MAKILFVGTHGTDDPTRATFPFMEAKAVIEAGHETGIILMMEAARLIKDNIAAQVQGIWCAATEGVDGFPFCP